MDKNQIDGLLGLVCSLLYSLPLILVLREAGALTSPYLHIRNGKIVLPAV